MPVYLCKPGCWSSEPWRHGIQVYAYPFDMDDGISGGPDSVQHPGGGGGGGTVSHRDATMDASSAVGNPSYYYHGDNFKARERSSFNDEEEDAVMVLPQQEQQQNDDELSEDVPPIDEDYHYHDTSEHPQPGTSTEGVAIRRVRHAEVVLVDDVCLAYKRYWLRLRWPGHKGGFAGYIALGKAKPEKKTTSTSPTRTNEDPPARGMRRQDTELSGTSDLASPTNASPSPTAPHKGIYEEEQDGGFFAFAGDDPTPRAPDEGPLKCLRTGLYFPSSTALQLLAKYDDGLTPPVVTPSLSDAESVFCRICREGLHDDEDQAPEEGPPPDEEEDVVEPPSPPASGGNDGDPFSTGPPKHQTAYHSNHYAAENPMLAPCECSGSMAFVHYLCIEQWRCRSRHPEARNGLHCETCGAPYALPPPSSRPTPPSSMMGAGAADEDWLEAMPAHVMAALRRPHLMWQIAAACTRRRWIRPLVPVLVSPLVALYCRARRLLKKRGVSRRRWACSLCRRRARWKCVRCLRSYYCSRHCQNVSWHIVHKHVCYKPARFWWSVVVYGVLGLWMFPGVLRDPLVYDLALMLLPASFLVMGILGGGLATMMKKSVGMDIRGRLLELAVVVLTMWLFHVTWGLAWAFFGDTSQCRGILGSGAPEEPSPLLQLTSQVLFRPVQMWFLFWDNLALQSPRLLRTVICSKSSSSCFDHVPGMEFFEEAKCTSDLEFVGILWTLAGAVLVASTLWKKRERRARALARAARRRERAAMAMGEHLHQD